MKFLLLGINEAQLPLLRKFVEADWFHALGWFNSESSHGQLRELFPAGREIQNQEDFERTAVNAIVLVANGNSVSLTETILRNLARDSMSLVFIQPACSAIFAAELDMIQRDTGAPMIPIHLDSLHPAIAFLSEATKSWDSDSPIGRVEQIVMEREAQNRDDDRVRSMLARDALLLRRMVGDFKKVNALQAESDKSLSNLSVHLTGSTSAITRWSIGPIHDFSGATISLNGEAGRIRLRMPDEGPWEFSTSIPSDDGTLQRQIDSIPMTMDSAHEIEQQIENGLDGKTTTLDWEDAYRAIDLADAASESIRRGKTLPINNSRPTEEDTFKSMMAAGGCLIIMVLPFLLLLISLIDGMQLPYNKSVTVNVDAGDRTVQIPTDVNTLRKVTLAETNTPLRLLTKTELYSEFGMNERGEPQAFAANRNEIVLAPIPNETAQIGIVYEGSFNIWKGWPFILLMPIALFLLLQLLKFVFPPRTAGQE